MKSSASFDIKRQIQKPSNGINSLLRWLRFSGFRGLAVGCKGIRPRQAPKYRMPGEYDRKIRKLESVPEMWGGARRLY